MTMIPNILLFFRLSFVLQCELNQCLDPVTYFLLSCILEKALGKNEGQSRRRDEILRQRKLLGSNDFE